ncbi:29455cbe-38ec-4116-a5ff-df1de3faff05 [Thermothielavioides terrestris]|uniref:29455cbe-38ec-4116-a5ff-df1de3faff05 n=1 Tax=Thermothielavioides terrestris TaxID=2587410 RepID=A0A446BQF6_9PEZI|nr:29455cbe-38ec-4116-a5ff-df1de3faff05 [Thermothielavioides terrestris]
MNLSSIVAVLVATVYHGVLSAPTPVVSDPVAAHNEGRAIAGGTAKGQAGYDRQCGGLPPGNRTGRSRG